MRRFNKPQLQIAGDQKGSFVVEFALIMPLLLFLIMAIIELSYQAMTDAALRYGARMGSRFGQLGSCTLPTGINSSGSSRLAYINAIVIQSTGTFLKPTQLTTRIYSFSNYQDYLNGNATETGPGAGGQTVEYSFSYTQPYLSPFTAAITGQTELVHTVNLVVQNEPFESTCS